MPELRDNQARNGLAKGGTPQSVQYLPSSVSRFTQKQVSPLVSVCRSIRSLSSDWFIST